MNTLQFSDVAYHLYVIIDVLFIFPGVRGIWEPHLVLVFFEGGTTSIRSLVPKIRISHCVKVFVISSSKGMGGGSVAGARWLVSKILESPPNILGLTFSW